MKPIKKVIPEKQEPDFFVWMDAHNHATLPDGAWFATLEDAAQVFMDTNKIKGCNNTAVHEYLDYLGA